jgi:hypothetical protein
MVNEKERAVAMAALSFYYFGRLWISLLVLHRLVLVLVIPVAWLAEHETSAMLPKKQVKQWAKERYQPDYG